MAIVTEDKLNKQLNGLADVQFLFNLLSAHSIFELTGSQLIQVESIADGLGEFAPGMADGILWANGKLKDAETCFHPLVQQELIIDNSFEEFGQLAESYTLSIFPNPPEIMSPFSGKDWWEKVLHWR